MASRELSHAVSGASRGEAHEVRLTQGRVALVDAEDRERVDELLWQFHDCKGGPYALHSYRDGVGVSAPVRKIYLHRFIIDAPPDRRVRIVNGDGLDCRRSNLRIIIPWKAA
jgi:hypothetical protein